MHVPRGFEGRHVVVGAIMVVALAAPTPLASGLQPAARAAAAADLWLQPLADPRVDPGFIRAVDELAAGRPARALPAFGSAVSDPILGGYARLYVGRSELALEQASAAASTARHLLARDPAGALQEAAWWLLADASEAAEDWLEARRALQALVEAAGARESEAHLRLGRVALRLKAIDLARDTFRAVYYDHPATVEGAAAGRELAALGSTPEAEPDQDLARAEQLFAAGQHAEAREAFARLHPRLDGDARSVVTLRLAQADFHRGRYTSALAALDGYLKAAGARAAEAEFYRLKALRALGRDPLYVAETARFGDRHDTNPLVEAALNDLGTFYILTNDDELAAAVFRTMYARFPTGAYADRAAWKAGWWAYKQRDYRAAIQIFDSAAAGLRRADFRPAWLYWAARAREQAGDREGALAAHRHVVADYRNLFYGRRSLEEIARLSESGRAVTAAAVDRMPSPRSVVNPGTRPPNAQLIQRLLAVGLYDDAVHEVRRAQRHHGTSPLLEATIGYAWHRRGLWRPAITALRRAYPQFMAAGGELLPGELLRMIYPLQYWDLIRKYAAHHRLDPYLMAALMCQESTFQADVRSPANAWGLMQVLPSTGRRYAARLGIRPFTTTRLTDPEVNIRIGMAYYADLRSRFGRDAYALAAYNAGENRLIRWRDERPGVPLDEFIDDIPFPETQQYVKRVLGTAEDYRTLYGQPASAVPQISRH